MGKPFCVGGGDPSCPMWSVSPAPHPDPFVGTYKDGARQPWDQNPMCFFCGWVPTAARALCWVPCEVMSPTTKQLTAETMLLGVSLRTVFACSGISFSSACWQVAVGRVQRSGETHPALVFPTGKEKHHHAKIWPMCECVVCIWGGFTAVLDLESPHLDLLSAQ